MSICKAATYTTKELFVRLVARHDLKNLFKSRLETTQVHVVKRSGFGYDVFRKFIFWKRDISLGGYINDRII